MADTISMPKLGFDMREGVLVRWLKNEGDAIQKGDVIAEIETDKATVEVESSASGIVRKILANQGDSIPVGNAIAIIGTADEVIESEKDGGSVPVQKSTTQIVAKSQVELANVTVEPKTEPQQIAGQVKASPLARKVASSASVDISAIRGSGPGGRIVRRDVDVYLSLQSTTKEKSTATITNGSIQPLPMDDRNQIPQPANRAIQTSRLRQAIGRRLVESKQSIPHFYVSHEYKMEPLQTLRQEVNEKLPAGEKISVNDFVVKAVALALQEFPNLNSSIAGNEILQHGSINVGVAVTVPGGLMTVVVKNTPQKTIRQISAEVKAMAARARDGKVKPDDVEGSTFSTSNLGMYDVENFTAIINPPEAAILAIGSSRDVPVVEHGQLTIGNRMKCTVSVDHRISDGAEAAQFMQSLTKYLEEPLRLLL